MCPFKIRKGQNGPIVERGRELYLTKVLIRDALFENLEAQFFQHFKSEMFEKFSLIVFERLNILCSKDFR